jgi:hypothetical protein
MFYIVKTRSFVNSSRRLDNMIIHLAIVLVIIIKHVRIVFIHNFSDQA